MSTQNFRALCAELVGELHDYASANPYHDSDELVARARAALAAEPVPPDAGGVAEPPSELLDHWLAHAPNPMDRLGYVAAQAARWGAADLLDRLDEPGVVEPTDEELEKLADDYMAMDGATGVMCLGHLDFARAALARWRHLAPQPAPLAEPPVDEEVAEVSNLKERALKALQFVDEKLDLPLHNHCNAIHTIRTALSRLAPQPVPEGPSDEELLEMWHGSDWFNEGATPREFRSIACAILREKDQGSI